MEKFVNCDIEKKGPVKKAGRILKKRLFVFAMAAVLLMTVIMTSGCVQMTENVRVSSDATINYIKLTITTNPAIYSLISENCKKEGYSNLQEYIKAKNPDISYSEDWSGDEVTITTELKNGTWTPLPDSKRIITDDGSTITYIDNTFVSENNELEKYSSSQYFLLYNAMMDSVKIDLYLEMPAEIIDSNAQYVDDNKAEWHLGGTTFSSTPIYAKSKKGFVLSPETIIIAGCIIFIIAVAAVVLRRRYRKREYY
ncbi:hypothetical protein J2128_000333 [Methanomicrobium sp. W14]|uniref:hypothetical protein n=1 Tax=Methanomicrobium sp. W14 TaxID=2817839 RepID=UPI001AE53406|nr:hypothetical protein [Methanomicrobium sp. W14]MBP2132412.1 hypothetical protein [Methanomicrobium sp. W14]